MKTRDDTQRRNDLKDKIGLEREALVGSTAVIDFLMLWHRKKPGELDDLRASEGGPMLLHMLRQCNDEWFETAMEALKGLEEEVSQ